jgi:adenosylhomocysteinase
MEKGVNFEVLDFGLEEQGRKNVEWAESQMQSLMKIKERFEKEKPLKGIRIGMALHVTKETAVLVKTLIAGGADVAITGCNPLSTQDDVAAYLAKIGTKVWAYKGESKEDYYRFLNNVINFKPEITIDDGCDLVSEIHTKHPELIKEIIGGCEETTTGVIRLRAMEKDKALLYPVVAINDLKTKHLFDNYLGTGQSTIDGILRASSILIAGKTFVVVGYGNCGKGVAARAKGLGANVVVCETNAIKALQAVHDGCLVMPMMQAAKIGDVFVTVTGNKHVIRKEHFNIMKNNAILANSGHFDIEIDVAGLKEMTASVERIRNQFDCYKLKTGKKIYLCGEGRLVNLAAAEGHPSIVMAQSFCGQALACEFLVENKGKLKGVVNLPASIDNKIAELQLEALGIKKDYLTGEQKKYLGSWKEGT